jgi:hypothetical protein
MYQSLAFFYLRWKRTRALFRKSISDVIDFVIVVDREIVFDELKVESFVC